MSAIRAIYEAEPGFPATDQHPDAARYRVGQYWVDAIGAEPSEGEVLAVLNPPALFRDISRPAFLFMMSRMGITEAQVEGLIGQMPEGDARDLALIVFKNQQAFKRDNSLLNTLTAAAGLTSEQVDTAWRAAEQLTW
jgi:hypothetical protein